MSSGPNCKNLSHAIQINNVKNWFKKSCEGSLKKLRGFVRKKELKEFLALKHNFHEIPKLGDFFSKFNLDNIKVKSAMLMFNRNDSRILDFGKKYLYLNYPGERYVLKNNFFKVKGKKIKGCSIVEQSIVITSDGTILPCCWDAYSNHILGNIENSTIEEIWNNKERYDFLKELRNGNDYEICYICPIKNQHRFSWDWNKVPGVDYERDRTYPDYLKKSIYYFKNKL